MWASKSSSRACALGSICYGSFLPTLVTTLGTIEKKYQSPLNGFSPLKYQSPSLKVYLSLKVVVNRSTWVVYRSGTRGDPSRLGRTNQYSLF